MADITPEVFRRFGPVLDVRQGCQVLGVTRGLLYG